LKHGRDSSGCDEHDSTAVRRPPEAADQDGIIEAATHERTTSARKSQGENVHMSFKLTFTRFEVTQ